MGRLMRGVAIAGLGKARASVAGLGKARRFAARLALTGAVAAGAVGMATAETHPVVVELYTSQGCSSCPPADALLHKLAPRDDVIALALHVDYWDYIGWKDVFADARHTQRQRAYARAWRERTIYTPQMVIGGADPVVGNRPMDVAMLIDKHSDAQTPVTLTVTRTGGAVEIALDTARPVGGAVVQLVRYTPSARVDIKRGENAGKSLAYANIVTEWRNLSDWRGTGPLSLREEISGDEPVVVIVQSAGHGAVLAAARLR